MMGVATNHSYNSCRHLCYQEMAVTEVQDNEEEEYVPPASMIRILKYNSPEWYYMLIGAFGAAINGGINPAFAVLFSEILGVSSD